ncbi:MAG TPA: hypothetical protein VGO90_00690 [Chthoniobacteraceae bacterium]|nr:hypothetical protein [Chthoniobacteraceae bacterium]
MRCVKLAAPLFFILLGLFVVGCNTLANRRDLYSPKKGDGYWTRTLDDGSWKKRSTLPPEMPKRAPAERR